MTKGGAIMKPTVYGIEKIQIGFDPESDVDIVLW